MKIAVLRGKKQFEIVNEPVPSIQPDELLVKVAVCGVCTGELEQWEDRTGSLSYPRYLGHEVSGWVEQVGSQVQGFKPGDPVGVWTTGHGYAEYVAVKSDYCYPAGNVPLASVLAEPLACAVNSVELASLSLAEDVVIIGAGFMGNLVQILAALRGPRHIIVADVRTDALERAKRLGADLVVDVSQESLPDVVKRITDGVGADTSFEVTGTQSALHMLGEVTRMSGKVVVVGFHQGGMRQVNLAYWNWMAFQILNAHFRQTATILQGMYTGMRLLTAGKISLESLVSHHFQLHDINLAFQTACDKPEGYVKAVIHLL